MASYRATKKTEDDRDSFASFLKPTYACIRRYSRRLVKPDIHATKD